mmetsp:Transcript_6850/g.22616  ORF Transcript_6850/g.22616 Transcript_6850/m.22616 type:complete len:233 (+) Transcript_6850:101-799(+)
MCVPGPWTLIVVCLNVCYVVYIAMRVGSSPIDTSTAPPRRRPGRPAARAWACFHTCSPSLSIRYYNMSGRGGQRGATPSASSASHMPSARLDCRAPPSLIHCPRPAPHRGRVGSLEAWGRYTHPLTLQAGEGAVSAGLAVRLGAPPPARLRHRLWWSLLLLLVVRALPRDHRARARRVVSQRVVRTDEVSPRLPRRVRPLDPADEVLELAAGPAVAQDGLDLVRHVHAQLRL